MKKFLPLLALAAAGAAQAHVGADAGAHHGFEAGLVHPFTGLDHLAAMLAVGIWSAGTAQRRWLAPVGFVSLLLVGALLARSGLVLPAVEPMVAASLLVVGVLLASSWRSALAVPLMAGFALFHGAAHGQELGGDAALAGMVLGTATLHLLGIGLGLQMQKRSVWLPRVAGALVALLGIGLLAS